MNNKKRTIANIVRMLVLSLVFVEANSACVFFVHQEKMPEEANSMKLW